MGLSFNTDGQPPDFRGSPPRKVSAHRCKQFLGEQYTETFNGGFREMGSLIKFYAFVIRVAVLLALAGQLKSCTVIMMNHAAWKTQQGIMSYSNFNRALW